MPPKNAGPARPDLRLAYTVPEFLEASRIGRTTLYKLIDQGKLQTVRVGGRRMIPVESAKALFQPDAGA